MIEFYNPEKCYDFSEEKKIYYDYIVTKYLNLNLDDRMEIYKIINLLEISSYELKNEVLKNDKEIIINRNDIDKQKIIKYIVYIQEYYLLNIKQNNCIECHNDKNIFLELNQEFNWLKKNLTQRELNVIFRDGCDHCKVPNFSIVFSMFELFINDYAKYISIILK